MPKVVVLGGNGLVGAAAAHALLAAGWDVLCTGRSAARFPTALREAGAGFLDSDRYDEENFPEAVGHGADVVVDCVAYTAAHARMLLPLADDVGSVVFISSKAVYVDDQGRHANSDDPPNFRGPVTEGQRTMAPSNVDPDSRDGYGANKVAAEQVLLDSDMSVSVLRPSRIHGVGAARPREWVFVKRVLDGRRRVFLAHAGRGANHPTAAANLGALVTFCAAQPGRRILNCADPDAPDGRAIARTVAAQMRHSWEEVLLDETAPAGLGEHPWSTWPPFVLDTRAATRLGFVPVGSYAETVTPAIDWLVAAQRAGDPDGVLPRADDPYFACFFDYEQEDTWIPNLQRG